MELARRYANRPALRQDLGRAVHRLTEAAGLRPNIAADTSKPQLRRLADRLSRADVEQLLADYESGVPSTQLTTRYGIGKGAVLRLLHSNGVSVRNQSLSADQTADAIDLYLAGLSLAEVGKQFGRDASLIHLVLKRAGVPRRDIQGRDRTNS